MESQLLCCNAHQSDENPQNVTGLHSDIGGGDEHHHKKHSVLKKVKAKAKKIKNTLTTHGHDHDHNHDEEDEGEEEEMEQDPEVHGAPMYDSAAIGTGIRQTDSGVPEANLEKPTGKTEKQFGIGVFDPPVETFGKWQEENLDQHSPRLERTDQLKGVQIPMDKQKKVSLGDTTREQEKLERLDDRRGQTGMEVDPQAPKDGFSASDSLNYQTKVTGPTGTGGEETSMPKILSSFDKMNLHDEPKHRGSHDQLSPEPIPTSTDSFPKKFDASNPTDMPRDTLTERPSEKSSGYTGVISSATSAIASKAALAKDMVASKLGYGGKENTGPDKMTGEGNAAVATPTDAKGNTYSGAISSATSAIADKAISAKNVVASKLGYGSQSHDVKPEGNASAATVTDKLSPVYGKVAGAGSALISKVPGVGSGTGTGTEAGTLHGGEENKEHNKDKGVSMKTYIVEKFRPGDEDRALSEVITGVLQKPKEVGNTVGHKVGSEVMSENKGEEKQMGKVTESKEVSRRLGTGTEDSRVGDDSDKFGVERGTVGWIKGTVNSWLGSRGDESQTSSQETKMSGNGAHAQNEDRTEERRLQSN